MSTTTTAMNLLTLPLVVIDNLLDYLDFSSLKKLRLVSKQTKEWIEQLRHLQKFRISVGTGRATQLLSSTVQWNNWALDSDGRSLEPFLVQYGPTMKYVEINNHSLSSFQDSNELGLILSHVGPNIGTLVIRRIQSFETEPLHLDWMENFKSLKSFQINRIFHSVETNRTLFDLILSQCSKLTYLTIPRLTRFPWNDMDLEYNKLVFQPILNYLRRVEEASKRTDLTIDFRYHTIHFSEAIFELVEICGRLGVRLSNFPVSYLPEDNHKLSKKMREMLDKIIVSVYAVKDPRDVHPLLYTPYMPPTTKVKMSVAILNNDNSAVIPSPIHQLKLLCSGETFSTMNGDLHTHLFETHRPTVEVLACKSLNYGQTIRVFGHGISNYYPNLTWLILKSSYCVCFHALFHELHLLERLKIDSCKFIDFDVLGNGSNPPILQLQKLSHLELLECANGLTDNSFVRAFRHMRLTTFVWTHTSSSKVTFWNGIRSLRTSGFRNSIRHFKIQRPKDCTYVDVCQFVNNHFPNIHDHSVYEYEPSDDDDSRLEDVESVGEEENTDDGSASDSDPSDHEHESSGEYIEDDSDEEKGSEDGLESTEVEPMDA